MKYYLNMKLANHQTSIESKTIHTTSNTTGEVLERSFFSDQYSNLEGLLRFFQDKNNLQQLIKDYTKTLPSSELNSLIFIDWKRHILRIFEYIQMQSCYPKYDGNESLFYYLDELIDNFRDDLKTELKAYMFSLHAIEIQKIQKHYNANKGQILNDIYFVLLEASHEHYRSRFIRYICENLSIPLTTESFSYIDQIQSPPLQEFICNIIIDFIEFISNITNVDKIDQDLRNGLSFLVGVTLGRITRNELTLRLLGFYKNIKKLGLEKNARIKLSDIKIEGFLGNFSGNDTFPISNIITLLDLIQNNYRTGNYLGNESEKNRKQEAINTILRKYPDRAILQYYSEIHHTPGIINWYTDSLLEQKRIYGYQISQEYFLTGQAENDFPNILKIVIHSDSQDNSKVINEDIPVPYSSIFSELHATLGDDPHEQGEDYTFLIQLLHRPEIMAQIERAIGVHFADYPFSIQPHFLVFLAYATIEDMNQVRDYLAHGKTTEEKYNRLRAFLSIGENRKFGSILLNIDKKLITKYGEDIGSQIGNRLFGKYASITEVAERTAEEIRGEFFGGNSDVQFSKQSYIKELLSRANDILEKTEEQVGILDMDALEKVLDGYDEKIIQYGSLFRVAEKDKYRGFEETMRNLGITQTTKTGKQLTEKEKEIVRQFYHTNYQGDSRYDAIVRIVEDSLLVDSLTNDVEYSFFHYQGIPILTIKLMHQADGGVYVGAFNAAAQFQKYSFGSFAFEKMLEKYSGKDVHGHVIQGNEHLLKYYARFGFEVMKDEQEKPLLIEEEGVKFYHILRRC